MNLWQRFESERCTDSGEKVFLHFEKGIEEDLRKLYIDFARWLRKHYVFPVRLHVHILNCERVRLRSGSMAYGSFRWFGKRNPCIRIPSAVESGLLEAYSREEVYEQILSSLVHELTHYYQWVLALDQSDAVSERQANYFRYRILDRYFESREK